MPGQGDAPQQQRTEQESYPELSIRGRCVLADAASPGWHQESSSNVAQLFSLVLLFIYLTTAAFSFTSTVATHSHQAETITHVNVQFSTEDSDIIY